MLPLALPPDLPPVILMDSVDVGGLEKLDNEAVVDWEVVADVDVKVDRCMYWWTKDGGK